MGRWKWLPPPGRLVPTVTLVPGCVCFPFCLLQALCGLYSLSFLTLHCYTYPLFHVLCKPLCMAGMLTVRHSMCARCCAFTLAQLQVTTAKSPHACAPPAQPCPTTSYLSPLLSNSPFGNQSQVLPIFPHQTQNL